MKLTNTLSFLILLLTASVASAHGVEVTTPDAKTVWAKGEQQKICWKVAKVEEVHLELIQVATKKRLPVAQMVKNTGEFQWKVGAELPVGQYKVLVISTVDEEVHGVSAVFEVR